MTLATNNDGGSNHVNPISCTTTEVKWKSTISVDGRILSQLKEGTEDTEFSANRKENCFKRATDPI